MSSKSYEDIRKYKYVAFILKVSSSSSGSTICCGPWAFNTLLPDTQLSLAITCLLFIPIIFKLFSALSHHLLHGLPILLIPSLAAVAVYFSTLLFCVFSTWTYCLSRKDFMNFKVSFPCNILFISLFVSVIQRSHLTDPYTLMTIYHSDILSTFIASVVIRVSVISQYGSC